MQNSESNLLETVEYHQAAHMIKRGALLFHPTESVYGVGCDPANLDAIRRLIALKERQAGKGFILVGSQLKHFNMYVDFTKLTDEHLAKIANMTAVTTWIVPAIANLPYEINGGRDSLAIRLTQHMPLKMLLDLINGPMISTSANLSGKMPCQSYNELNQCFQARMDLSVLEGELGGRKCPSQIIDIMSGDILRKG